MKMRLEAPFISRHHCQIVTVGGRVHRRGLGERERHRRQRETGETAMSCSTRIRSWSAEHVLTYVLT